MRRGFVSYPFRDGGPRREMYIPQLPRFHGARTLACIFIRCLSNRDQYSTLRSLFSARFITAPHEGERLRRILRDPNRLRPTLYTLYTLYPTLPSPHPSPPLPTPPTPPPAPVGQMGRRNPRPQRRRSPLARHLRLGRGTIPNPEA